MRAMKNIRRIQAGLVAFASGALVAALFLAPVSGCHSHDEPSGDDMMTPVDLTPGADMVELSCCGFPGDKGNALGVGKFCASISDCSGNRAGICSSLGNSAGSNYKTFFCTFICTPGGDAGDPCGAGASCQCDPMGGRGCACTPDSCVNNPAPSYCKM
jgi:hypothetical protein